jgi:hypothetical protein
VKGNGEEIASAGFQTDGWIPATVPGTVLSSYKNIGALPDPNYSANQLNVSESFFNSNFWYRNEFTVPEGCASFTLEVSGQRYTQVIPEEEHHDDDD